MNPQTARWYLELIESAGENPETLKLLEEILSESLGTKSLAQAVVLLERVAGGEGLGQSIPNPEMLQFWQEELEKAQIQKKALNKKVILEIREDIRKRQLAAQIHAVFEAKNKTLAQNPQASEEISQEVASIILPEVRKTAIPQRISKIDQKEYAQILAKSSVQQEIVERIRQKEIRDSEGQILQFEEKDMASVVPEIVSQTYPIVESIIRLEAEEKPHESTIWEGPQPPFARQPEPKEQKPEPASKVAKTAEEKPRGFKPEEKSSVPHFEPVQEKAKPVSKDQGKFFPIVPLAEHRTPAAILTTKEKTNKIPDKVQEQLAEQQAEGVVFIPFLTFLSPTLIAAFLFKKTALAPVVKPLQVLDKVAGDKLEGTGVPEWREMLHEGLSSNDLESSLVALREAGLEYSDPKLKELEVKRMKIKAYEQAHPKLSGILGQYHQFTKLTGRRLIFSNEIGTFLPRLSPKPWVASLTKHSYSLRIKKAFDGLASNLFFAYDKKPNKAGQNVLQFVPQDKFIRLVTFGKIKEWSIIESFISRKYLSPILIRLGKTAFGKGLTKAAAWFLAKLGIRMAIKGAAAALAAPLTGGLSFLFLGIFELAGKLLGKFAPLIKKFSTALIGAALGLAGLAIAFPLNIVFFAGSAFLLGTAFGGAKFALGVVGGIGAGMGAVATAITGLILAITAPIAGTIGAGLIIGSLSVLAGLTFFIVTTTAGAFILPQGGNLTDVEKPSSEHVKVIKTVSPKTSFDNSELPFILDYKIQITATDADLVNVRVSNILTLQNKSGNRVITEDRNGKPISSFYFDKIPKGETREISYSIQATDPDFKDSTLVDEVVVQADIPSKQLTNEVSRAVVRVTIGGGAPPPSFACGGEKEIDVPGTVKRLLTGAGKTNRCGPPNAIVIHWSGGYGGNQATYNTLVATGLSCQFAVDPRETWQMLQFFETKVEEGYCAGNPKYAFSINFELDGAYFDTNPPPESEIAQAVRVTCWSLKQYNIPRTQIFGHYELYPGKVDPGVKFLQNFKNRVAQECP